AMREGALSLSDLGAMFWPANGNHLYLGLAVLGLGAIGVVRNRDVVRFFWLAIFMLALVLVLGTPIAQAITSIVPGVAALRLPHRYEAWLGPAGAVLAGLGMTKLVERRYAPIAFARLRRHALVLLVLGVCSLPLVPGWGPSLLAIAVGLLLAAYTLPARWGP